MRKRTDRSSAVFAALAAACLLLFAPAVHADFWASKDHQSSFRLQTQGEIEARRGNWLLAEQFFLQALELEPDNVALVRLAARAALELGSPRRAEKRWRAAVEITPLAWLGLAELHLIWHEYPEALNLLQRYLEQDPEHAYARFLLGLCQFKLEQYDAAYRSILQAGSQDPDLKAEALIMAAEAKWRMGDNEIALKALQKARAALPAGSEMHGSIDALREIVKGQLIAPREVWVHVFADLVYNDNKLFATQKVLDIYNAPLGAGKRLDNDNVVKGVEGYLRAALGWHKTIDAWGVRIGYALSQQFLGFSSGDYQNPLGATLDIRAPAKSNHVVYADIGWLKGMPELSLEPGLEVAAGLDLPDYSLNQAELLLAPKLTLWGNHRRSATFYVPVRKAWEPNTPSNSFLETGLGVRGQVVGESQWVYLRGAYAGGTHIAGDAKLNYSWQQVRMDTRQYLYKGWFLDLDLQVQLHHFRNRSDNRLDTRFINRYSMGYAWNNRTVVLAPYLEQNYLQSNIDSFDRRQHIYGLRLGGAF